MFIVTQDDDDTDREDVLHLSTPNQHFELDSRGSSTKQDHRRQAGNS